MLAALGLVVTACSQQPHFDLASPGGGRYMPSSSAGCRSRHDDSTAHVGATCLTIVGKPIVKHLPCNSYRGSLSRYTGICLFYLPENNRNRQLKLRDSAPWASSRRGADRRGWEDLLRCGVANRSSKRGRGDVYAAGAVLDQGYVLPAINGSEL